MISTQLGGQTMRMFSIFMSKLPIPKLKDNEKMPYINCANLMLSIADKKEKLMLLKEKEAELNRLVNILFGLSQAEMEFIECQ